MSATASRERDRLVKKNPRPLLSLIRYCGTKACVLSSSRSTVATTLGDQNATILSKLPGRNNEKFVCGVLLSEDIFPKRVSRVCVANCVLFSLFPSLIHS